MLEAWPPHNLVQEFEFARLESCRSYSFRLERQVYGALLPDSPPDQRPLWPSRSQPATARYDCSTQLAAAQSISSKVP